MNQIQIEPNLEDLLQVQSQEKNINEEEDKIILFNDNMEIITINANNTIERNIIQENNDPIEQQENINIVRNNEENFQNQNQQPQNEEENQENIRPNQNNQNLNSNLQNYFTLILPILISIKGHLFYQCIFLSIFLYFLVVFDYIFIIMSLLIYDCFNM